MLILPSLLECWRSASSNSSGYDLTILIQISPSADAFLSILDSDIISRNVGARSDDTENTLLSWLGGTSLLELLTALTCALRASLALAIASRRAFCSDTGKVLNIL